MGIEQPLARTEAARAPSRGLLVAELFLVLGLSLGRAAAYSVVNLVSVVTARPNLPVGRTVLNGSLAPGRPVLDLTLQLLALCFAVVPVALAAYLLVRSGESVRELWLGGRLRAADLLRGVLLAAAVGVVGLPFYLATHDLGPVSRVVPDALPHLWWRFPVLTLSAFQNGLVEECIVIGFVLVRLRRLGLGAPAAVGLAAVLRGSYHLYQGPGGFVGNLVMGLLFGWLYLRWRRLTPLILAHTLLDVGAFIGFALLAGRVAWVPT